MVGLAIAGYLAFGIIGTAIEDDHKGTDPTEQAIPAVGDCIGGDKIAPIIVACNAPSATVQVLQVVPGNSPGTCKLVAGATDVFTHESVTKIGGKQGIGIGTLVERATQFTMLLHLPPMPGHRDPRAKSGPALAGHGAEAVRDALAATITNLPTQLHIRGLWLH